MVFSPAPFASTSTAPSGPIVTPTAPVKGILGIGEVSARVTGADEAIMFRSGPSRRTTIVWGTLTGIQFSSATYTSPVAGSAAAARPENPPARTSPAGIKAASGTAWAVTNFPSADTRNRTSCSPVPSKVEVCPKTSSDPSDRANNRPPIDAPGWPGRVRATRPSVPNDRSGDPSGNSRVMASPELPDSRRSTRSSAVTTTPWFLSHEVATPPAPNAGSGCPAFGDAFGTILTV